MLPTTAMLPYFFHLDHDLGLEESSSESSIFCEPKLIGNPLVNPSRAV